MEKVIWKFPIETTDKQEISIPKGANILCVQTQFNEPNIWAYVNPKAPLENRIIEVFGTGHPINESDDINRRYIGTYQTDGGNFVFHVWERND